MSIRISIQHIRVSIFYGWVLHFLPHGWSAQICCFTYSNLPPSQKKRKIAWTNQKGVQPEIDFHELKLCGFAIGEISRKRFGRLTCHVNWRPAVGGIDVIFRSESPTSFQATGAIHAHDASMWGLYVCLPTWNSHKNHPLHAIMQVKYTCITWMVCDWDTVSVPRLGLKSFFDPSVGFFFRGTSTLKRFRPCHLVFHLGVIQSSAPNIRKPNLWEFYGDPQKTYLSNTFSQLQVLVPTISFGRVWEPRLDTSLHPKKLDQKWFAANMFCVYTLLAAYFRKGFDRSTEST